MAAGARWVTSLRGARGARSGAVIGVLLVVALLVAGVLHVTGGGGTEAARRTAPTPTPTPTKTPTVSDIYQQVAPSVTIIRTAKGALGTGVIAADDGTVLTADHVVEDGSAITVVFADGTRSTAKVASADPKSDIATLTPATLPEPIVPVTLGGAAQVGGPVVAIGNPLGLTYSTSSGVISGLNRTAKTNEGRFSGLIQFDASVNPGSSGGPLLDAAGNLIGIVVSIADPGGVDAFAGIAFAVPIGTALGGGGPGSGRGPQI